MGWRRFRPLFFALVIGLLAVTVLLLQDGGQGSASGGWAYRYGRWTWGLDPDPGLVFDSVLSLQRGNLAAGGPGVIAPVRADRGCSGQACGAGPWGALLAIRADGQRAWSKLYYKGTLPQSARPVAITLVKPYGSGFLAAGNGFLMGVDSDGNVLWAVDGLVAQGNYGICGDTVDVEPLPAGGFAYLTARCLFRLDGNGHLLWVKKFDARLWSYDIAPYGNNIAVAGTYAPDLACGSSYNCYGFIGIVKADGSGFEWLRYYYWEDPVPRNQRRQHSSIDAIFPQSDGGIIAFGGAVDGDPVFKVDADGLVQWWRRLAASGGRGVGIGYVAPYLGGFIVAAYYYQPPGSAPCGNDIALVRLDSSGIVVNSGVLGGDGCDSPTAVTVSGSDIYVRSYDAGLPVVMKVGADLSLEGYQRPGSVSSSSVADPFPNDSDEDNSSRLNFVLRDQAGVQPQSVAINTIEVAMRQAPWYWRFVDVRKPGSVVQERTLVSSTTSTPEGTSTPEEIDCGDTCWGVFPGGSQVTLSLSRTLHSDWVPYFISCRDPASGQQRRASEGSQVTFGLPVFAGFSNERLDVTCDVGVDSNAIRLLLRADPSTLMLRQLQGSDRPPVSITLTLIVRGQPVPGVAVQDIAILDVSPSTLDVTRARVVVLPEPQVTDENGRYVFYWLPPQASYFEGAELPAEFRFGACVDPFHPSTQYGLNYFVAGCTSGWLVRVSGSAEVTGRVVQRHAGALDDPDGDGLRPVAGALVSTDPTFPPDRTVVTDVEGRYSLEVEVGTRSTLYVRKPSGEGYDRWTQTLLPFSVETTQAGQTVELEDVYLAHMRVAGQMLENRLPQLQSILGDSSDGVRAHRAFVQSLLNRAPPSYPGTATEPWEEEALRRLSLAEWAALNGAQVMYRLAECGVTLFWDASLGAVTALFDQAVDRFLQAAFKKAELIWKERLLPRPEDLAGAPPELVQQVLDEINQLRAETQRLSGVQLAIAEFIASLRDKIFTRQLDVLSQALNNPAILENIPGPLSLPSVSAQWSLFLNDVLSFVQRALSDYDLAKAVYDAMKAIDQAASEATSWPSVVDTINNIRDQLLAPALNALDSIQGWLRDLASGPARAWVDRLLVDSARWAQRGEFAQTADSYARAREMVTRMTHELSEWWTSVNSVCENTQTWIEFARNAVGGLQIAAALGSLVTGGATLTLMPMLNAINWTLLGTQGILGLAFAFVGARPEIHPVGELTKQAVYAAFDRMGQDGQAIVEVHSPVHLAAVDREGRMVGMDGQGNTYMQVPGAVHLRGGQVELVDGEGRTAQAPETLILPSEHGPYTLLLYGTGSGSYSLEARVFRGPRVLLSEDFTRGIPSTWQVVDGGSGGGAAATWTTANPGNRSIGAPFSSPFAIVDSDAAGRGATQDEQLITPDVDLGPCSGRPVRLSFSNLFRYYSGDEIADVDISVDGGVTWTNVLRMRGRDVGPETRVLDLTGHLAGATTLRVRFHYYNASWDEYWAIDNVTITCGDEGGGGAWLDAGQVTGTISAGDIHVLTLGPGDGGQVGLGTVQQGLGGFDNLVLATPEPAPVSIPVGQSSGVVALLADDQGRRVPAPASCLQWQSSDPTVARIQPVEGTGIATVAALKRGSAHITATCDGREASLTVTVEAGPPAAVRLELDGGSHVTAGQSVRIRARVLDAGGGPISGMSVRFTVAGEDAGASATGGDGYTPWVDIMAPNAIGPAVVTAAASWGEPPNVLMGFAVLYVAPGEPAVPEHIVIFQGDRVVGRLEVPAGAFADGMAPIVSAAALGAEVELPPPPTGWTRTLTVAVSLLDAATVTPIQAQVPLRLTLLQEGSSSQAGLFRLRGNSWEPVDTQITTDGLSTTLIESGVFALLTATGSPPPSSPPSSPPPPPSPPPPSPEKMVISPTGSGQLTFRVMDGLTLAILDVEPFTGTPPVLPSSLYQLPHGVYSLRVEGLPRGASVTIQVRLPSPAPVGTVWLKLIGGRWVALPVGSDDGDNVITVTLTDGGQGDADGVVNGVIADPGGPAIPLRIAALWGDVDCDGVAGVGDALKVLRHVVRLPVTARQPCPRIEERVLAAGALRAWGDVDGDGVVGAVDALKLLRHLVRLSVSRAPGTPSIGGEVEVSPPGEQATY